MKIMTIFLFLGFLHNAMATQVLQINNLSKNVAGDLYNFLPLKYAQGNSLISTATANITCVANKSRTSISCTFDLGGSGSGNYPGYDHSSPNPEDTDRSGANPWPNH